jgi:hypothetical protein
MTRGLRKGREPRTVPGTALGAISLAARRAEHLRYALARHQDEGPTLFSVPLECGQEALLMFSSRVPARHFISTHALDPEWRATKFSVGALISLLVGPYTDIDWVLLDPFPGCLAGGEGAANLVHWHDFVDHLLG